MALEGPQLRYARVEDDAAPTSDEKLARALRLAQMVEEMLDDAPSSPEGRSAHSTRMARAMAASLVDELETLVRGGGARSSRSA